MSNNKGPLPPFVTGEPSDEFQQHLFDGSHDTGMQSNNIIDRRGMVDPEDLNFLLSTFKTARQVGYPLDVLINGGAFEKVTPKSSQINRPTDHFTPILDYYN